MTIKRDAAAEKSEGCTSIVIGGANINAILTENDVIAKKSARFLRST
jgi:hypothetical protein